MSKKIKLFIMYVMMIMTGNCLAKPISPYFTFSVDTVNVGGPVNAPIMFYGASGLCAFQMSIVLPQGISPADGTDGVTIVTPGELCADHEFSYNYKDGVMDIACLSMTNSAFNDLVGVAFYVALQVDSVETTTSKEIWIKNVEVSTSDVRGFKLVDECHNLTLFVPENIPDVDPEFSFTVSPFTFSGSFESSITINSSVDLSSIAFKVTVPQVLAINNLFSLFGYLIDSGFSTVVVKTGTNEYYIRISAQEGHVIPAGTVSIAGIAVQYVLGLIPSDVYTFYLDDIAITTSSGKVYNPAPFEYTLDLTGTLVESADQDPDSDNNTVSFFTIDGREIDAPVKGIILMRQPNGKVTKVINR